MVFLTDENNFQIPGNLAECQQLQNLSAIPDHQCISCSYKVTYDITHINCPKYREFTRSAVTNSNILALVYRGMVTRG